MESKDGLLGEINKDVREHFQEELDYFLGEVFWEIDNREKNLGKIDRMYAELDREQLEERKEKLKELLDSELKKAINRLFKNCEVGENE